jgi:hypothetical protein
MGFSVVMVVSGAGPFHLSAGSSWPGRVPSPTWDLGMCAVARMPEFPTLCPETEKFDPKASLAAAPAIGQVALPDGCSSKGTFADSGASQKGDQVFR